MYEIEVVGEENSFKSEADHVFVESDDGYFTNDVIDIKIKINIVITALCLYKDGEKVGYRMVPVPFVAVAGDLLSVTWSFSIIRR